jgi:hypothetical protein
LYVAFFRHTEQKVAAGRFQEIAVKITRGYVASASADTSSKTVVQAHVFWVYPYLYKQGIPSPMVAGPLSIKPAGGRRVWLAQRAHSLNGSPTRRSITTSSPGLPSSTELSLGIPADIAAVATCAEVQSELNYAAVAGMPISAGSVCPRIGVSARPNYLIFGEGGTASFGAQLRPP